MKAARKYPALLLYLLCMFTVLSACSTPAVDHANDVIAEHFLTKDQTHNKFSSIIPPVLRVQPGAVIEAETEEASDAQMTLDSSVEEVAGLDFDLIHPITGPVYVEGAEPGDILAVTLHSIEVKDWGWTLISPGFGFLADEFKDPYLRTWNIDADPKGARFSDNIYIPYKPFPGVMGVAPAGEELLTTIPPRANGGNMDNPYLTEGTTVYFPVFVEGALFSIGDGHAVQGLGEVCGSAIEVPLKVVYELNLIKTDRRIHEPQYETDQYFAVSAFGLTIDEAARKAVTYMIDYLEDVHGIERTEGYVLCSLAGDLHIAEVVDVPHMLVTMHMQKSIFGK